MTYYKIKDPEAIFYNGHMQTYWAEKSIKPCVVCGTHGGTKRPNGLPRRSKDGLCNTCYHREMRKGKRAGIAADMVDK